MVKIIQIYEEFNPHNEFYYIYNFILIFLWIYDIIILLLEIYALLNK